MLFVVVLVVFLFFLVCFLSEQQTAAIIAWLSCQCNSRTSLFDLFPFLWRLLLAAGTACLNIRVLSSLNLFYFLPNLVTFLLPDTVFFFFSFFARLSSNHMSNHEMY